MFDQVVLFDVGQTLLGPARSFGDLYAAVLHRRGYDVDAQRCEQGLQRAIGTMDRMVPSGQNRYAFFPGGEEEYWQRVTTIAVRHALGQEPEAEQSARILKELRATFLDQGAWHVFPDVLPTLNALKQAEIGLAVVSNWDSRLREVLRLNELLPYFHEVVASAEVGVEKPNPEIFLVALRSLGAKPSTAVHVGDRIDLDVHGAKAAGIRGLWLDRGRARDKNKDLTGVERISSLEEILTIVRKPA